MYLAWRTLDCGGRCLALDYLASKCVGLPRFGVDGLPGISRLLKTKHSPKSDKPSYSSPKSAKKTFDSDFTVLKASTRTHQRVLEIQMRRSEAPYIVYFCCTVYSRLVQFGMMSKAPHGRISVLVVDGNQPWMTMPVAANTFYKYLTDMSFGTPRLRLLPQALAAQLILPLTTLPPPPPTTTTCSSNSSGSK